MTCRKSQGFLAKRGARVIEQSDARKTKIGPADAVRIARQASHLWVAKGKQVVHFNMARDKPSESELRNVLLGPSGTLRAPVIRFGNKLFVGFDEACFAAEMVD